jgi:hypothetical protein
MKTELIKGNFNDLAKLLCSLKEEHNGMELLIEERGDLYNVSTRTNEGKTDILFHYDREEFDIDDICSFMRFEILVSYDYAEDLAQEICEWKNGRLDKNPMEEIEHRYTFELI